MENKTSKYFKYALGEIVLVIVGILIALQVNTQNEKRKIGNEMKTKIKDLVINLEDEIAVSGIFRHPEQIQNLQNVLDGEVTKASLEFLSLSNLMIKDDVLEENIDILIQNEDRLPERYKPLVTDMKSLKFYFSNYKRIVQEFTELKRNNERILENNYAWYSLNDSLSNEKRIQYYATDSLFRNRLFTIVKKYRQLFSFYSSTIQRKINILCTIKKIDENYTANDFRTYLSSSAFRERNETFFDEGKKVTCDTKPNPKVKVSSSHILINSSTDTITVFNPRGFKTTVLPDELKSTFNSSDSNIIEIYRNDTCEAYQVTNNNFIIIE